MRLIILAFLYLAFQRQQGHAQEETSTSSTTITPSSTILLVDDSTIQSSSPPPVESTTVTVDSSTTDTTSSSTSNESIITQIVGKPTEKIINNLSDQVRNIIQHFQNANSSTVDFPNRNVLPDPLLLPNTTQESLGTSSEFYDIAVHGLSNFTLESVNMQVDQMEVYVKVHMKNIYILGNCTLSAFFLTSKTPFNLTLEDVIEEGKVSLVIAEDGTIRANQSLTEMTYQHINFQLSSNVSDVLTSFVNTAGSALMVSVRPQIQQRIDEGLTVEVNKQLESTPKFPAFSKTSPVDMAVLEGRKYVRDNYDPYTIKKIIDFDSDYLAVKIGPVAVHGLSRFARVGDVKVGIVNRTAVINLRMLTGRLLGNVSFELNFGKTGASRIGNSKFSVQHVQFEAIVKQPLNLSLKPQLDVLQLEVGKVTVQMDGKGKFDYMLELALKFLPDLIRHLIVDALEETIKIRIQNEILDHVDSEKVVLENLPLLEKVLKEGI